MDNFSENKDKLEAKNQDLLSKFGSRLDQSLKDLHKTVLGSVCEQQEQLRCMKKHVGTFLDSKYNVRHWRKRELRFITLYIVFCKIINQISFNRWLSLWIQKSGKWQRHTLQLQKLWQNLLMQCRLKLLLIYKK